jgi:hypothetical protein
MDTCRKGVLQEGNDFILEEGVERTVRPGVAYFDTDVTEVIGHPPVGFK